MRPQVPYKARGGLGHKLWVPLIPPPPQFWCVTYWPLFKIAFEEHHTVQNCFWEKSLSSPTSLFCTWFTLRPRKANNLSKITHSVRCESEFFDTQVMPLVLHWTQPLSFVPLVANTLYNHHSKDGPQTSPWQGQKLE